MTLIHFVGYSNSIRLWKEVELGWKNGMKEEKKKKYNLQSACVCYVCVSSHATATDECVTLVSNARMIGVPHRLPYIHPYTYTHTLLRYTHIYIHFIHQ